MNLGLIRHLLSDLLIVPEGFDVLGRVLWSVLQFVGLDDDDTVQHGARLYETADGWVADRTRPRTNPSVQRQRRLAAVFKRKVAWGTIGGGIASPARP